MKPLLSESEDNEALKALGKASVQIVHDLKNQLNGLKLYATFLRNRLEKSGRPDDELDTVRKLMAGLDRTAKDVSLIVEYGRPLQPRKQPGTDLERILREVVAGLNAENLSDKPAVTGGFAGSVVLVSEGDSLIGAFDPALLTDALKSISLAALRLVSGKTTALEIRLKPEGLQTAVIEWKVFDSSDHDPFNSFAGSNEIRLSLAAKVIEAHGGSAKRQDGSFFVRLPLAS
ncbi:MAG TPA: hypothetical protein VK208_23095 [Pyrinomonadaceae bacterium]|jgi:signal transduction histidine kinase|nr:hypothetical protein [Pyrinomonadaceae bacterium]